MEFGILSANVPIENRKISLNKINFFVKYKNKLLNY